MSSWTEFEPMLREGMNAMLDSQPESLLECDGGPVGKTADIILARLIGFDDQIDDDRMRLKRVEPVWLTPIRERIDATAVAEPECYYPTFRIARYVLQSGYAEMKIDPTCAPLPPGIKPGPDFLVSVLFVRYRRRI